MEHRKRKSRKLGTKRALNCIIRLNDTGTEEYKDIRLEFVRSMDSLTRNQLQLMWKLLGEIYKNNKAKKREEEREKTAVRELKDRFSERLLSTALELLDIFPEPNDEQIVDFSSCAGINPDYLKDMIDRVRGDG